MTTLRLRVQVVEEPIRVKDERAIKPLSLEDARHVLAAQGWLELGDAVSAGDELREVSPGEQTHPAVLQIRFDIHAKAGRWDEAVNVAEVVASMLPDEPATWIHLAYATRRKTGGSIPEARKILETAEPAFPDHFSYLTTWRVIAHNSRTSRRRING